MKKRAMDECNFNLQTSCLEHCCHWCNSTCFATNASDHCLHYTALCDYEENPVQQAVLLGIAFLVLAFVLAGIVYLNVSRSVKESRQDVAV